MEQRKAFVEQAARQRDVEFAGGATKFTGGTPETLDDKTSQIGREFYDFYRTARGRSSITTTQPTLSSNPKFMNFYPLADLEMVSPRPLLFITGAEAHSREFSEDGYRLASEPKELVIVPGAGHVDLYDRVNLIPFDKLTTFFRSNLNNPSPAQASAR
ncbi:MAG TPA: alpha/beta hydrolase [Polyangiaceae bacterium]|nr:alpha/beta hydrolase [Polyangiaceae bacterium]